MKKTKQQFFPDFLSLLLILFFSIISYPLLANEAKENILFEKNFKSLEMESIDRVKVRLVDLPSPIVIVNFWASWCIPCLHEIPSLIALSKKLPKNELSIVAINTDEEDQLKNIAKTKASIGFPESFIIIPDKNFKIANEFKFSAIPVTVIFKKGKVIYFKNGPVDFLNITELK